MKDMFRSKKRAVIFVVVQLAIYIGLFWLLYANSKMMYRENDRQNSVYSNRVSVEVSTINQSDIFTKAGVDVTEGNVLLAGNLKLDFDGCEDNVSSQVILKSNEEFSYQMVKGRLPGTFNKDEGEKQVALGRNKYKYAYERNGKEYVDIEGEPYEVVGVLGSEWSDYWDNQVVLNINCLGSSALNTIMAKKNYTIELMSNIADLNIPYLMLYGNIRQAEPESIISRQEQNLATNVSYEDSLSMRNKIVSVIIYIACVIDCIVIIQLCINQRRAERSVIVG